MSVSLGSKTPHKQDYLFKAAPAYLLRGAVTHRFSLRPLYGLQVLQLASPHKQPRIDYKSPWLCEPSLRSTLHHHFIHMEFKLTHTHTHTRLDENVSWKLPSKKFIRNIWCLWRCQSSTQALAHFNTQLSFLKTHCVSNQEPVPQHAWNDNQIVSAQNRIASVFFATFFHCWKTSRYIELNLSASMCDAESRPQRPEEPGAACPSRDPSSRAVQIL